MKIFAFFLSIIISIPNTHRIFYKRLLFQTYTLARQNTIQENGSDAFVLGINITGQSNYECFLDEENICSIVVSENNIHYDFRNNLYYVLVSDAIVDEFGDFTNCENG